MKPNPHHFRCLTDYRIAEAHWHARNAAQESSRRFRWQLIRFFAGGLAAVLAVLVLVRLPWWVVPVVALVSGVVLIGLAIAFIDETHEVGKELDNEK